ncbi:MAG: citrate (Si)-synthase [Magnetococcales bacterium]|nr:citrate (Si)-synthase [Magnetococcales bacterium]
MAEETVTIVDNRTGNRADLPILQGTEGPSVVDISRFYKEFGLFTLDPGFQSTASCESAITFVDGDEGILLYRGYPVEQLAEKSTFLEVCYLLLEGELPTRSQYDRFCRTVMQETMIDEQMRNFYKGYRHDAHPMAIMVGMMGAFSAFFHDSLDIQNPKHRELSLFRLIGKLPTIAAASYKYSVGQPFIFPKSKLGYIENFLRMLLKVPSAKFKISPRLVRAMEQIFILHADHEQGASASTVRLAGSSMANPFAAISAGISSLWGPTHGGADEAVLQMLREIGSVDRIGAYIQRAKDPNDPFRLMGFGHRVYKKYDPRARMMKKIAQDVLSELGREDDPLFQLALKLEEIAHDDDYFCRKGLCPNIELYSGIAQSAIGIPSNMFTVVFAMARSVGWICQWMEMIGSKESIGRPRQLYVGASCRDYVPLHRRP